MNLEEYKRSGRDLYGLFAKTVEMLLRHTINQDPRFRLQHIQHRAKTVESLSLRLQQINEESTECIEAHRKDLAGCRVIFYTNHDVNRFKSSGILGSLFEVDWIRSRIHQPELEEESVTELFQSSNFIVKLKSDRTTLMEYREFEGLLCEVQVQTILNHAWAEMAHDTIYKQPKSPGLGSKEIKQFEKRLRDAMRDYLLPAGYLFQSIAHDVQRLSDGKTLFDAGVVDAIVNAQNNNDRYTALRRLKEHALPIFDDVPAVFPEIREKLKEAWNLAESTETVPFEGTLGVFGGIETHQITTLICEIITEYRYIDPDQTYVLIRDLFLESSDEDSKEQLIKTAISLSKHELQVWQSHGPVVQVILSEQLSKENDISAIAPLAMAIAKEIFESDVVGATASSNSVSFSQGTIVYSDALQDTRRTVINVIAEYANSVIDDDQLFREALECLFYTAKMPQHGDASFEVYEMIYSDLAYVVERLLEIATNASFNSRQDLEFRLYRTWQWKESLSEELRSSSKVVDAHSRFIVKINQIREFLNADEEFVTFKTVVGYQSVCPQMWEYSSFDFERDQTIRRREQENLASLITTENWPIWKIRLTKAVTMRSKDRMTFQPLVQFLSILSVRHLQFVVDLLSDRDAMPSWTISPIAQLLLETDARHAVETLLNEWLDQRKFLQEISTLIVRSNCLQIATVERTVEHAVDDEDQKACKRLLQAAISHSKDNLNFWREQVFFPCLRVLKPIYIEQWIHESWYLLGEESLFEELTEAQTNTLLEALVVIPRIDADFETVLVVIASQHQKLVLNWFGQRIKIAQNISSFDYNPIPISFHSLRTVYQSHAEDVIAAMWEWWDSDVAISSWKLSEFLIGIFPDFEDPLLKELLPIVKDGQSNDLKFIASLLRAYKGRIETHPILREIIASDAFNEEIDDMLVLAIRETGIVSGAYGIAQAYQAKADMLRPWLNDNNERVAAFAEREIHMFEQDIALENRRVSEQIAMRRLDHDEPLTDHDPPADKE